MRDADKVMCWNCGKDKPPKVWVLEIAFCSDKCRFAYFKWWAKESNQ